MTDMKNEQKIKLFRDIPQFTRPASYHADYPLNHLVKWVDEAVRLDGLQMNPDFQRGHVWTRDQEIKFMEFLLRGGKTGRDLYFNHPNYTHHTCDDYDEFVCVDGLQRITAIKAFMNDEIPVFGSYFSEFQDSMRFIQDTMRVHINNLTSRKAVMTWYIEMNAGGTPHSENEIRRVQELILAEK